MRVATILFSVVLAGCQSLLPPDRWSAQPVSSVMPFWALYQRCMATTDADVLVQSVKELEQAHLEGSEPPDWMKSWGGHVVRQPLRTAVDPRALSAACTVRTASAMVDHGRLADARTLSERVIARYPDLQLTYYVEQAKGLLATLPLPDPALLARR